MICSIIVTYNGSKWIDKCIGSLINSTKVENHKIIVVDNNSIDNTISIIQEHYPSVEIILTNKNLGFGKANNIGIRKALKYGADFIFLLNQDAHVKKDTIYKLMNLLICNKEYDILSPMQFFSNEILDFKFKNYFANGIPYNTNIVDVKFVNAAIWLVRAECFRTIGMFHESFDHYGEDEELCNRIIFKNKKIGVAFQISSFHERPQIEGAPSAETIKRRIIINLLIRLCTLNYNFFNGVLQILKYIFIILISNDIGINFFNKLIIIFSTFKKFIKNNKAQFEVF